MGSCGGEVATGARHCGEAPAEPPPCGVPAEEARLVGWAEWAASTTFSSSGLTSGYDKREVDAFRSAVRDTFLGVGNPREIR
jgi:hypothetical protein